MRFLVPIILILSFQVNHIVAASPRIQEAEENSESRISFSTIEEAQKYLQSLKKERQKLEGDFYGINITAYRYVNIFYPMGYIRYKIQKIDEEIERLELEIKKGKEKSTNCRGHFPS